MTEQDRHAAFMRRAIEEARAGMLARQGGPFGALLGAIMIYWVLGYPTIRKELNTGRETPLGQGFGFVAKYIYVPIAALVLVLGILWGGIG